jgi:hypothetical protein
MPVECFGVVARPDGVVAIEKVTRYGGKILDRASHRLPVTDGERQYLQHVVELINAVLYEHDPQEDFANRGSFVRQCGEMAYAMSIWWFALRPATAWTSSMRAMRDLITRVITNETLPTDSVTLLTVIEYLRGVNTVVSRTYNV